MKLFLIISVTLALCYGSVVKEARYAWFPNDDSEINQVDLQQPPDETTRDARVGDRNEYWLFTRHNPVHPQHLTIYDENELRASNYRSNVPTKVLVHGWTNSGDYIMNLILRDVFLADTDCNIIVVDWNEMASMNYALAVLRIPSVGRHLGDFLNWLITTTGGSWDQVHLVGFSLGAHIVGNAGVRVGGLPARVTALDPAGPLWHINPFRITKRAGQYVEGIHTNGALLRNMLQGHGIMDPVGHADFYPNGGATQPGCPTGQAGGCSHARAYELFAASISYNNFRGRRCDNLAQAMNEACVGAVFVMGNDFLTKRGSGLYGLKTTNKWPF